jgi:hypothetical protein
VIAAFPAQPSHRLGVLRGRAGADADFGLPQLRPSSAEPWKGVRRPNKRKPMQIKPWKKAWISLDSFGRIGSFQWVTANPNKKLSLTAPLAKYNLINMFNLRPIEP